MEKELSGTIIRGTLKAPNSQLVTPISTKLQRPDGCEGSRPRRISVSPEAPLQRRTNFQLARGPVFAKKQPWPNRHANRPNRRSI
jgi:hypothetical protein